MCEINSQKARYSSVEEFIQGERGYLYYEEEYDQNKHKKGNAWEYDLKFEFDHEALYQFWEKKNTVNCQKWIEELNDLQIADPVVRFLKYKNQPEGDTFDCDGSGEENHYEYLCKLTRDIYKKLWGWQDEKQGRYKKGRYKKANVFDVKNYLGPDTMNSFWTTCKELIRMSFMTCVDFDNEEKLFEFVLINGGINTRNKENSIENIKFEKFEKNKSIAKLEPREDKEVREKINKYFESEHESLESLKGHMYYIGKQTEKPENNQLRKERFNWLIENTEYIKQQFLKGINNDLEKFAILTHSVGNMTLVPAGFNTGRQGSTKDYWDLSLAILKKEGYENSGFEKDRFNKYINTFFLWDYVDKEYKPKSLFSVNFYDENYKRKNENDSHSIDLVNGGQLLPKEDEFKIFINNVNWAIKRRGIFMVAMLKIALLDNPDCEQDESWVTSDIYKKIMDKVFLSDKCYSGYNDVFNKIKNAVPETQENKEIREILKEAKDLILN